MAATRGPDRQSRTARYGLLLLIAGSSLLYVGGGLTYVMVGSGSTLFVNDGFQYYCYLPSLVLDQDLDFTNEYAIARRERWGADTWEFVSVVPETGRPANAWSMGPALLWLPFFLLGLLLERLAGAGPSHGFGMWCQWPVYLGSLVYGLLAIRIMYRTVLHEYGPLTRLIVIGLLVAATNLNYYFVFAGQMSHSLSFFAVAAHLYCLKRVVSHPTRLDRYLLGGLSLGLVALVRWQDAVLCLMTLAIAAQSLVRVHRSRKALLGAAVGLAGLLPAVAAQALCWQAIYGRPFLVPQGGGWMTWTHPYVLEVLLSDPVGFYFNSPILVPATVGLIILARRERWWAAGSLLALLAAIYASAASSQWEAGESFGMRRLISTLPLLGIGLCEFAGFIRSHGWTRYSWAGAAAAVLWNWTLLTTYFIQRTVNP